MSHLAEAVALGDLSQSIRADGQGEMRNLQVKVNCTIQQFNTLVDEVARVAQAARAGDAAAPIRVPDVHGKWKVRTRLLHGVWPAEGADARACDARRCWWTASIRWR